MAFFSLYNKIANTPYKKVWKEKKKKRPSCPGRHLLDLRDFSRACIFSCLDALRLDGAVPDLPPALAVSCAFQPYAQLLSS